MYTLEIVMSILTFELIKDDNNHWFQISLVLKRHRCPVFTYMPLHLLTADPWVMSFSTNTPILISLMLPKLKQKHYVLNVHIAL